MNMNNQCTFGKLANALTFIGFLLVFVMSSAAGASSADQEKLLKRADKLLNNNDIVKSMELYRKLADEGYAPAQSRLGYILDQSEENEEAVRLYRLAANQGYPGGEHGLGVMYLKGEGVEKDNAKGVELITRAAKKGYVKAIKTMITAYKKGLYNLDVDPEKASLWESRLKAQENKPDK